MVKLKSPLSLSLVDLIYLILIFKYSERENKDIYIILGSSFF